MVVPASDRILGFEDPRDWTASGGTAASTTVRTQGEAAYALADPPGETRITSALVSSTAAALAGIGDVGARIQIDVQLPMRPGNPNDEGSLELSVSCPSRGIDHEDLGKVGFTGKRRGIYTTLSFPVSEEIRSALGGATYNDLRFHLKLESAGQGAGDHQGDGDRRGDGDHRGDGDLRGNGDHRANGDPRGDSDHRGDGDHGDGAHGDGEHGNGEHGDGEHPGRGGTYLFDNLRVRSTSTPPAGAGQSVDLVALLSYSPAKSTPGAGSFPVGIVQVPQSFHVKLGSAGTSGSVKLELGFGITPTVTCTYVAGAGGREYVLSSCTGGQQAGDLLGADFARLTIIAGDPGAGTTKIRAQLALNPVGDTAGSGIIPPMPTFWGDTPASASQIVTDYFNLVNPGSEEIWVKTPVPDFARRHGDGSPHDNLTGIAPPAGDPPFDQEGHMNKGGNWDAYWRLAGNLAVDNVGNRATTEFGMELSAHAVVWGLDKSVVSVKAALKTDNGEVESLGFKSPSATASVKMYVFGIQIPVGGSSSLGEVSIKISTDYTAKFSAPPIRIWIFAITIGVDASAGLVAGGSLSFGGFAIAIVPKASVGAHIEGGVDIAVAKGTVSATIDLLAVSTPVTAMANWEVTTAPDKCRSSLTFHLDADLKLTALGGKVELNVEAGFCPFCAHKSWTLFAWDPVDLGSKQLFTFTQPITAFPLPPALCTVPLNVFIATPKAGDTIKSSVPTDLLGSALRPSTPGFEKFFIDCARLRWTSSDASDIGFPVNGCSPSVTFGTPGPRTITLTATDSFKETGSATVSITVGPKPIGAYIVSPKDGVTLYVSGPISYPLVATELTATTTYTWTATNSAGVVATLGTGSVSSWVFTALDRDTYTLKLTAKDTATGVVSTATETIRTNFIK